MNNTRYGRLKIEGTVLSKRLIAKLIDARIVRGFDDPRLYTLVGLRRRGVPPGAILSFVNELGVSTSPSEIQISRFENSIRRYLEQTVPRLMVILDPIPVIIQNLPEDYLEEVEMPFSPKNPEFGTHLLPFTRTVYIDRSDFREVDSKDYFRLAPGKSVGLLKVPYPIRATSFTKDDKTGKVTEVQALYEKPEEGPAFKKPKTYIQWVAKSERHGSPIKAEVRMFNQLIEPALAPTTSNTPATKPSSKSKANENEKRNSKPQNPTSSTPNEPSSKSDTTTAMKDVVETDKPDPDLAAPSTDLDAAFTPSVETTTNDPDHDEQDHDQEQGLVDSKSTAFLKTINPRSEEIFPDAMIEIGLHEIRRRAPWPADDNGTPTTSTGAGAGAGGEAKEAAAEETVGNDDGDVKNKKKKKKAGFETVRFQGLRVAYFCLDNQDCEEDDENGELTKIVLNRIVSLKEDAGKGAS